MDSIDEDAFLPDSGNGGGGSIPSDRKTIAGSTGSQQYQLQHQPQQQQQLQHQHTGSATGIVAANSPRTVTVHPSQHLQHQQHQQHQQQHQVLHHPAVQQQHSLGSRRSSQSSSPATPRESIRSPLVVGIPTAAAATPAASASAIQRRASGSQAALGWTQTAACEASPIMHAFATSVLAQPILQPPPLQLLPTLSPPGFRLDPKKHYASLGRCGLRVSCLGLGTWVTFAGQVPDSVAEDILTLAYACGINFFDTAEVYAAGRAELLLGRLLRKAGWRRSSYTVSTKIFWGGKAETERGLSRKHIVEGLQACLQRLQLDYVDIVFANRPDPHTPMEEIVRAFSFCIDRGWAFYWGTSRWSPMEIMEAHSVARQFNLIPPVAEQVEYHMFQREKLELQMPELFAKLGLGAVVWSPLACGILSGKYDDGVPVYSRASLKGYSWLRDKILSEEGRQQQAKLKELADVAARLDCTLAQLAIAWCVRSGHTSCVLLGASSAEQLYENICALPIVTKLTGTTMAEIDRILGNKPLPQARSGQQQQQQQPSGLGVAQTSASHQRR